MAAIKQVKEEKKKEVTGATQTKKSVIVPFVRNNYKPIPKFKGGCKNC